MTLCPMVAKRNAHEPGERGESSRGYLDGRSGLDPRETSDAYSEAWLQGAGDAEFLARVKPSSEG